MEKGLSITLIVGYRYIPWHAETSRLYLNFNDTELGFLDHPTRVMELDFNRVHVNTKIDKRERVLFREHNEDWIKKYMQESALFDKKDLEEIIEYFSSKINPIKKIFGSATYEAALTSLVNELDKYVLIEIKHNPKFEHLFSKA